jgi:O-antigen ligase
VELGVPGALAFLAIMISLMLSMWRLTRKQLRERTPQSQYAAGLVAFFVANVGSLTVSGQILADPFIAAFLGILVGVALSFARPELAMLTKKAQGRRMPARMPPPDPLHELPGG